MIPKLIHYCWFGGAELPESVTRCIETWKRICPDYEIVQWNESNYDIGRNSYMQKAYESGKWGFVPDYARLDLVYEHGGFYFDTDVEMIRSLDSLRKHSAFFGMESPGRINPGIGFGAEKENPLVGRMRSVYTDMEFVDDFEYLQFHADPDYQFDLFRNIGLETSNREQMVEGATVFPTEYFAPKDMVTGILTVTGNTYAIHHFDGSWAPVEVREYNRFKWRMFNRYGKVAGLVPWAFYVLRHYGAKELFRKIGRHL